MMNTWSASSSTNGTHIRVCSDARCKAPLTPGCKGNLCPTCVARMRSPRVPSNGRAPTVQQGMPPSRYTPSSVASYVQSMSGQNLDFAMVGHQAMPIGAPQMSSNAPFVPPRHHPAPPQILMQRSFAVPHQRPNVMYVPNMPGASGPPAGHHFNARGELIRPRQISPTVIDLRAPQRQILEPQPFLTPRVQDQRCCVQCGAVPTATPLQELCSNCLQMRLVVASKRLQEPAPLQDVEMRDADIRTRVKGPPPPRVPPLNVPQIQAPPPKSSPPKGPSPQHTVQPDPAPIGTPDNDIVMDDLELVYPDQAEDDIPSMDAQAPSEVPQGDIMQLAGNLSIRLSGAVAKMASSTAGPSNSKQAVSVKKPPRGHSGKAQSVHRVSVKNQEASRDRSRSLKLCSSDHCTGIVSSNSSATRCLQCIKKDWKLLKDRNVKHDNLRASETSSPPMAKGRSPIIRLKVPKRKGVTWADQREDDEEMESIVEKSPLTVKIPKMKAALKSSSPRDSSPSPVPGRDLSCDPFSESAPTSLVEPPVAPLPEVTTSSLRESPAKSPDSTPRIRLPENGSMGRSPSSEITQSTSQTPPPRPLSPLRVEAPQSVPREVFEGWESDLTELSESTDDSTSDAESSESSESESDSESDSSLDVPLAKVAVSSPSQPTGLKIRIPARPGGVFAPKCANPRCNNTLALGYRWKSCVLCRARNRDYQRRRHNVQAGHMRLDQELEVAGITVHVPDISSHVPVSDTMPLVPGARLCSVRDCSFIVPSKGEYIWKMCALCRLRRREHKKPQAERIQNRQSKHADLLLKLLSSDFTCARLRKGRCQSFDCGVLLTDPELTQCPQCSTRRLRLMKRGGHYPLLPSTPRHTDEPVNPSPYPQFSSFSAFLVEYKARLTGFLHAQSVFFLFKQSKRINSVFALDGEFSVVSADFDLLGRRSQIQEESLRLKRAIEHVGRLKFSPPQLFELDVGGIAMRFNCIYSVPILQSQTQDPAGSQAPTPPAQTQSPQSLATVTRHMKCEMEIATLPDHSHRFLPGQRTIIRFRLLG